MHSDYRSSDGSDGSDQVTAERDSAGYFIFSDAMRLYEPPLDALMFNHIMFRQGTLAPGGSRTHQSPGHGSTRHFCIKELSDVPSDPCQVHRPLNAGFRFSAKARRASTRSSVFKIMSYAAFSDTSPFCQPLTACMAAFSATGPPSQMSRASCRLTSSTFSRALPGCCSSSGETSTSLSHKPRKYASGPETLRPVNMRSRARLAPINAGRR